MRWDVDYIGFLIKKFAPKASIAWYFSAVINSSKKNMGFSPPNSVAVGLKSRANAPNCFV
jgi:hypothetical protein